jgi:formylglycine-generating enzyme required for sulfatase activity
MKKLFFLNSMALIYRSITVKTSVIVGLLALACLTPGAGLFAQSRGLQIAAAEVVGQGVSIGKQWAVFIAIDKYQAWGPLQNPVKDAKEIRDILKSDYYIDEFIELYDSQATAAAIRRLFGDLRQKAGKNDSVFVFYAGHGITDDNTKTGSWIPVNAGTDFYEKSNWLPNTDVRSLLANLPAKHVFLVSDACFSGDLLNTNRGASPEFTNDYFKKAYAKVSRQVMTSGASEEVPDSSEFAMRLKSILSRSEEPCLDPLALFTSVRQVRQTQPMLGYISGTEHEDGGSFLFFRRGTAAARPTAVQPAARPAPAQQPAARVERPAPENFIRIEGGTFTMGSPSTEADRSNDETQHQVTVSGFYLGKYEVTQAEYEAVMGTNPSRFKGANLPVENVSWYDAIEYCNRRSGREGLTPAYTINKTKVDPNNRASEDKDNIRWLVTWNKNANGYRLPTEAEWEYACRAGLVSPFSTGSNITASQANYNGNFPYNNNAKGIYREKTTAVGSFGANRWGLYDMHGNVYEWCWDWYSPYNSGAQTDPVGASSGAYRVPRGGGWHSGARYLRSASRYYYTSSDRVNYLGFRLLRP